MPPRTTRKSYRLRASDRTMVGTFCNRTACRIRNRRRRHDSNMNLRKKRTPRASQHYVGWRARQKSLLLPVAGEVFSLDSPLYRTALTGEGIGSYFRFGDQTGKLDYFRVARDRGAKASARQIRSEAGEDTWSQGGLRSAEGQQAKPRSNQDFSGLGAN